MDKWEFSALVASTSSTMTRTVDELCGSYALLTTGGEFVGGIRRPSWIVAEALDAHGGVICPLLYAYREANASSDDLPFLENLCNQIDRIFALATDVAKRTRKVAKSGFTYARRFFFKSRKLFGRNFISGIRSRVMTAEQARERLLAHICKSMRRFLEWLREDLWVLESQMVVDPMRPIAILPYARGIVEIADRKMGLLVLKPISTEGSQPFHIRPGANLVWNVVRQLCGAKDPDGYVALPRDYAKPFRRTDSHNDLIDDDCSRLLRHIVPNPGTGTYRLELTEKPRLQHGL